MNATEKRYVEGGTIIDRSDLLISASFRRRFLNRKEGEVRNCVPLCFGRHFKV
jgi:hypothetical protein